MKIVKFIPLKVFLARGYKTFFMLNSAEHEILNAHKYKISRIQLY